MRFYCLDWWSLILLVFFILLGLACRLGAMGSIYPLCLICRLRRLTVYACVVITHSRVQINRVRLPILFMVSWTGKKILFPVRAWEFGFARQVWLSRFVSGCSFSILTLNLVLTHGFPPGVHGGVHIFLLASTTHHRVSPEFMGWRNCVPMAVTAESPLAQGQ